MTSCGPGCPTPRSPRPPYTAFTSTEQPITARLIVRRVKDLNRQAAAGQDELFDVWRYHAVFTDSPFMLLQAEAQHRDHAIVEQVFADWSSGPLAHLPSGLFPANAAWLALAAISHNLLRAAGALASLAYAKARGATLRRDLIDVAARTRPPRPRPHHRAPARRLAPRAGMDEPVRSRHRPACPHGLTSPDPVTAPNGPTGHADRISQIPATWTSRRYVQRQETHARLNNKISFAGPASRKRSTEFPRWIEVKHPGRVPLGKIRSMTQHRARSSRGPPDRP